MGNETFKRHILRHLDKVTEKEYVLLLQLSLTFPHARISDLEQAVSELVCEGSLKSWAGGSISVYPLHVLSPGSKGERFSNTSGEINDLPEVP